ncbi:MAG TPA: hypothetical protein VKM54_17990 [Myxococcota bacterium]|nr:hypothetical protein [Myxococcota bacterium]
MISARNATPREGEFGDREFLEGDAFPIADIAVATQFVNLH